MNRILIIDDDPVLTMLLSGILKKSGYDAMTAADGTSGLKLTATAKPDMVITDYQMPDYTGLEVLEQLKAKYPTLPVIILTAHGDVSLTIKAIQNGAFDFIEKPIDPKEILEAIKNGLQSLERTRNKAASITPLMRKSLEGNLLVGKNPVMREIFKNIGRVSLNMVNVMITGETGTGKERVARLIHYSGITREHPLVVVNCGAGSEEELEKELFGVIDNRAKTGVRIGKIEQAEFGTLYLREVSLLPVSLQTRLMEVLKNRHDKLTDQHAGGSLFKARIIASSSHHIEEEIEQGRFLKELYYQINEFVIHVPPLRERLEDIPELVNNLLHQLNPALDKKIHAVDDDFFELLKTHQWPGNVRELKNIMTQAMILSHSGVLQRKHILIPKQEYTSQKPETEAGMIKPMADVEKEHITRVLTHTNWNKQETAALLGITRPTLNAKIEKYKIIQEKTVIK